MRYIHRFISVFACLVMLWLGVTGSIVESIDFYKLSTGAPESDVTVQSINDHIFGNPDYAVVIAHDFSGKSLPKGFDYPKAFASLTSFLQREKPGLKPQFVEVRMLDGRPIGQAGFIDSKPFKIYPVAAVDLTTGASTRMLSLRPSFPEPFSVRQFIKNLHRYWFTDDSIGGWVEILSGVLLWVLLVTGLVVYFRLLILRTKKLKRKGWFWRGGSQWVMLHRWISVAAAVFLIVIAFSGTVLGFETAYHSIQPKHPAGAAVPLLDSQIKSMAQETASLLQRDERSTPVRVMRLRYYSGMSQGVIVTGESKTRQLVYNMATGKTVGFSEPGYPPSSFPFGPQVHLYMERIHAGEMFGLPVVFMNILAGLSLTFLSVSGIIIYTSMWRKRAAAGLRSLIWK